MRKARKNSSISKVWNTLRTAQKYHSLRAAGVDAKRAEANAASDWSDLSPDLKGALLAGWNMATVGGTTRRYSKGDTTRRMPVLVNRKRRRSRRNPVAKPFGVEGSHTYAVGFKGGGWRIYETYKTYADAMDWAKFIMKEGIPGVRGNVQALVLRPTGQRTYSVYWRGMRRVASNPVPIWMQSDEMFHKVVGVSIKEWQRIFRALPEWKKKEFHRRAGKKILSANAMKWVVSQGQPASLSNPKLSKDGSFKCVCGAKLYPDGQDVDCACGASYNAFGQRLRPRSQWAEGSDYNKRRSRRAKKNYIYKGRVWYVGLYKTSRGLLWDAKATMQALNKGIVGKILKISAPSSSKAIQEAWKHRRRLGL